MRAAEYRGQKGSFFTSSVEEHAVPSNSGCVKFTIAKGEIKHKISALLKIVRKILARLKRLKGKERDRYQPDWLKSRVDKSSS